MKETLFFKMRDNSQYPELVTICIPVRNGEFFIQDAIDSCLNQTYKNYEILIVDNASTDATINIVTRFSSNKINLIRNPIDIGITANFNLCIEHARGKYIKFLCADDVLNSNCIERMFLAFEMYPKASLVIAQRTIINNKGAIISKRKFSSNLDEIDGYKVINKCLFGANFIGEPTAVMFRRNDAQRGFSMKYRHLLDLEMWFHLLEKGTLVSIKEPLCSVRRHDQQMTVTSIKSGALLDDNKHLFQDYIDKSYINKSLFNILKWKLLYIYRYVRYKKL